MADALDTLQQRVREAKSAQAFIEQANALLDSGQDLVVFTCANPPYSALFSVALPKSLWQAPLEQAIVDQQSKIDAVSGATSAVKVA